MSSIAFEHNTAIFGTLARLISGAYHRVTDFATNYVSRTRAERQLSALDDRLLSDIGLDRCDIHQTIWTGTYR